ncbi:ATP/GTP-binding protein [Streptomyces spiroverticillatus]|uniref:ATP/GTP-binding protein n=1 Tax=Streptomyces finlayi TaxID=67296 RepID=A0A918X7Q6_9ACTN|nr:hypothetical protein [Streptomyces finlayi]GHA46383.1 ATP/GTP-binding protein [Streptomyces spiroverticillatus]GHD16323.1 ATP/GTP-binding protein [Streptomyces finlayi]
MVVLEKTAGATPEKSGAGVGHGMVQEEGAGRYVARAELVLARPHHRRLTAAALDPDPLQLLAAACAHVNSAAGEQAELIVDLLPVSGARVARWRRKLIRQAQAKGPSAYGEQLGTSQGGGRGLGLGAVWSQVAAGLNGGRTGGRPPGRAGAGRLVRQRDLAEQVGKFLPSADTQVFAVQVLVRVVATHPARARARLHQVVAVLDAWSGENWWRPVGPRHFGWRPYSNVWWRRRSFDRRCRTGEFAPVRRQWVTSTEIAALLKPPSARCTAANVRRTGGVVPAAPSQLPTWTGQRGVVPLGAVTGADGRRRLAALPQQDLLFGASYGKSGFGKSELALLQAIALAYGGEGDWFLDPHGAAVKRAKPYLTHPAVIDRVWEIDLSVKDRHQLIASWNPLSMEGRDASEVQDVIGAVVGGLASAQGWGDGAPRARAILSHAVQVLAHLAWHLCQQGRPDLQPTLFSITRLLTDEMWRQQVLAELPPKLRRFWIHTFPKYEGAAVPVVTQTLEQLETSDSLRAFLGQPRSSYSARRAMDEKKIVLLRCSGTGGGDQIITSLLLFDLFQAGISREGTPQHELATCWAFADELTAIDGASRGYVAAILEQLRKYELRFLGMTQMAMRLSPETRMALMQNQSLLSATAADADEAAFVAKRLAGLDPATLQALPKYTYVMSAMLHGKRTTPFRVSGLAVHEVLADYYRPDLLPALEAAITAGLHRQPVGEILAHLDGDDDHLGLDDVLLAHLTGGASGTSPAPNGSEID